MPRLTERALKREFKNLRFNEPLKKWTTFRIGGPARYFFLAKNEKDLIKAITLVRKLKINFFVLGGGSNVLISDKGFKGLVVKLQIKNYKLQKNKIIAGAGVSLGRLVAIATRASLAGLEWAAGIPGTLAGAIYGNAGWPSNRKNISAVIEKVKVLNIKNCNLSAQGGSVPSGQIENFSNKDCQFAYRNSIFKKRKDLIILSAILKLKKGNKKRIKEKILEIFKKRKDKTPEGFSAGCAFKNPKFKIQNSKLLKKYPELQNFRERETIPSGWLIEKCGLKGKKIGQAKISEKHANFIINQGRAKAKDILRLIKIIEKMVFKKFNLKLEKEIELIGF